MRFLRSKKAFPQDDASLIAAYKNTSDSAYIGILFDRYCHLVFAVCMNYLKNEDDSKDAVIYLFEKLAADLKKYEINNFSHWIYSVAKHHCLKQLGQKRFTVDFNEQLNHVETDDPETGDELTDQLLSYLGEAITTLNEEQRTCIQLFYLDEKSYKEIEYITGYNFEKVKSHIQNGKRNLKIYLLKKNGKR